MKWLLPAWLTLRKGTSVKQTRKSFSLISYDITTTQNPNPLLNTFRISKLYSIAQAKWKEQSTALRYFQMALQNKSKMQL